MTQSNDFRAPQSGAGQEHAGAWGGAGWSSISQAVDLNRLIAAFRRRLKLFLAVALLVLVVTVIATIQATPLYTATAI